MLLQSADTSYVARYQRDPSSGVSSSLRLARFRSSRELKAAPAAAETSHLLKEADGKQHNVVVAFGGQFAHLGTQRLSPPSEFEETREVSACNADNHQQVGLTLSSIGL